MSDEWLEEFRLWINQLALSRSLGLTCTEVGPEGARVEVRPTPDQRNPDGAISGAVLTAAADIAGGVGVTAATGGKDSATAELSVHFLAPARLDPLIFDIEILRKGRRTCVPQIRIFDAEGRLCATATGTWLLREAVVDVSA